MESKIDKQKCNADADKKTSVESSPHIWGNLLRWCNSDATNQPLTGEFIERGFFYGDNNIDVSFLFLNRKNLTFL